MSVVTRVAIGLRAGYHHIKLNAVEQLKEHHKKYVTEKTLLKIHYWKYSTENKLLKYITKNTLLKKHYWKHITENTVLKTPS